MSKRSKIVVIGTFLVSLCLIVLRLNPRVVLTDSTILQKASELGCTPIVYTQLLLGVDPNGPDRTPLINAIMYNHPAVSQLLIDHGADLDRQWASGEPSGPALYWALHFHRVDIAKMLLRAGADPNYLPRQREDTALEIARHLHDPELMKLLAPKGTAEGKKHQTAIERR